MQVGWPVTELDKVQPINWFKPPHRNVLS